MKRMLKYICRIVACIAAITVLVSSVSASEVIDAVQYEITVATAFPLEVVIDDSQEVSFAETEAVLKDSVATEETTVNQGDSAISNAETIMEMSSQNISLEQATKAESATKHKLIFSLKEEFLTYYQYSLDILDAERTRHLLSEMYDKSLPAEMYPIEEGQNYAIYVKLYTPEEIRCYAGELMVLDGEVSVDFKETGTKPNYVNYIQSYEEGHISELSDEQYEEIFGELDIPSFISEEEAKEAKHIQRMEEYANNDSIIGYKNADGTNTVYLFSSPVRYKDDKGVFHDADPNLVETTGSVREEGYSFVNDFGELKSYYTNSMSNSQGVKIKKNQTEFEFGFTIPEEEKGFFKELSDSILELFSGPSNQATVNEEKREQKVKYEKLNSDDMQIEAKPTMDGATQILVLNCVPESNKLTFWVDSSAVSAAVDEANSVVEFSNETGKVFSVGNIEMRDAHEGENASGVTHFSTNNTVSILSTTAERTLVEVTLDEEMLTSPVTEYPVTVSLDASTYAAPTGEIIYSYFEDRTVYNNGTTASATNANLVVGKDGTYYDSVSCTTKNREGITFMKYDLCSFTGVDPSKIANAKLVLHEGSGNSTSVTVNLKRVTSSWTETTVTSSFRNCVDNNYIGNTSSAISGANLATEHFFDITRMFVDHLIDEKGLNGGIDNYGFQLRSTASAVTKRFCSTEHGTPSYRPKLVVTYREDISLAELGLNTEKAYWIKNKQSSQYLTVSNNQWESGSYVGITCSVFNPSIDDMVDIQYANVYWQIEDLGDGEYRFIPFNSRGMRLNVYFGDNYNGKDVALYTEGDEDTSIWRIERNADGGYSILSKASYYTKGLRSCGIDENADIYDREGATSWEFLEVRCTGLTTDQAEKFADGNALIPIESGGYTRYRCPNCGCVFKSPEEQDCEILQDETGIYATMVALQKSYVEKLLEKDFAKADATMRIMNDIRAKMGNDSNGKSEYDFRDEDGNFASNYNYQYTSYDFYVNISTSPVANDDFENFVFDLATGMAPPPYNFAFGAAKFFLESINQLSISFSDLLEQAVNYFDTFGEYIFYGALAESRFLSIINTVSTFQAVWDTYTLLTPNNSYDFDDNFTVTIKYRGVSKENCFWGDYCFDNGANVYIKQEKLIDSSGDSAAANRYNQYSCNLLTQGWIHMINGYFIQG